MRGALATAALLGVLVLAPKCGSADSPANLDASADVPDGNASVICQQQACSRFSQCIDNGDGTANCLCQPGYLGARCTECAPSYQDRNGDGSCEEACAAGTCPVRGSCDDSSGTITCRCDPGFVLTGSECVADGTVPVASGRTADVELGPP